MPLADYRCPDCTQVAHDIPFRMIVGAIASAPDCPDCGAPMEWIPQAAFDMKTDGEGGRGFQKFEVSRLVPTKDGQVQVTEQIDSLHRLRQIEKDSEQRFRNGEGEPLRFRGYAQNRSNMDVGSFGTEGTIGGRAYDSGKAPSKRKQMPVTRHGTTKPTVRVARGGGVSPLSR